MKKRTYINEDGDTVTFEGVPLKDIKLCIDTVKGHWKEIKGLDTIGNIIILIFIILISLVVALWITGKNSLIWA